MLKPEKKTYKIADFVLDTKRRQLFRYDKSIALSSRAFEILLCLVEKRGEIVEKEEILSKVWSDSFVEEGNLAVHISALRRVLSEKRGESTFIKTISGRGYSFIAPVREVEFQEKNERGSGHSPAVPKSSSDNTNSIAVLPFGFSETNSELDYLANGLTQSLIGDLSQIQGLKVMAHSAVRNYKNSKLDFQEIGFLLGVEKILTGYISTYKGKLEIEVELLNASDRRHLWGMEYDFEFSNIFEIKKNISMVIAEKLKLQLPIFYTNAVTAEKSENSEAFRDYLKGKYILETISTRKDLKKDLNQALKFFHNAIEKNPKYALAYTGIGDTYIHLFNNNLVDKTTAHSESEKTLRTALKLDEKLSEAFVLKGTVAIMFEVNLRNAEKSLDYAIKLNANNPEAYHWLSFIYICLGKFEKAFLLQNKAVRLDPTSIPYNNSLMRIFYFSGNYHKAVTQAEEILELDNRSVPAHLILALSYAEIGLFEEASRNIKKAVELRAASDIVLLQAYIYALTGDIKKTRETVFEVIQKTLPDDLDYTTVAIVYSALKQKDKAFFYLDMAYEKGQAEILHLKVDPRLKNLRDDQRYRKFIEKLDLA